MSDRSVEDELAAEARKFGHAMAQLLRLHAQAGTWLERRKLRKQISRTLREQRRAEQVDRDHQLSWTEQMINRYRAHSLAVADRAADSTVDHDRRYRDAQALARHGADLRGRIVTNTRLTPVERGIALDGVDAATTFPQFETGGGRLFSNAHKVRGIEALRYRAQLARTREALRVEHGAEQQQWEAREQSGDSERESEDLRFSAQVSYLPEGANHVVYEHAAHASEAETAAWTQRQVAQARPAPGTTVQAAAYEESSEGRSDPLFRAVGRRQEITEEVAQWQITIANHAADREHEIRQRGGVERPPDQPTTRHAERDAGVADAAGQQRLAEIERRLREISEDRDRLASRVGMLQRGVDAVTADRDQIRKSLAAAEGRIEELKNRNIRLASEIGELYDRPDAAQVAEERDRYKRERDEAVAKLHARTPAKDRYGSAEKVVHERLGDTQAWPAPERPTGAERNGRGRNGFDRGR
ncbi:hypothetical protein [Nocardia xishanensis]